MMGLWKLRKLVWTMSRRVWRVVEQIVWEGLVHESAGPFVVGRVLCQDQLTH